MSQEILNNVRQNLFEIKPYSPGKPISELKRELGLTDIIKLASNENPLGPSIKVQQAVAQAVTDLHRYPDGAAYELKSALAAVNDVPREQILVGNGSDECIKMISETFITPDSEIIIPNPSFSQYWFGTQVMAGNPVLVDLTPDFEYDMEQILQKVNERTKILYLCTPNNPTGTYIKRDRLQWLLDRLPKHVLVVIDEAYIEFVEEEDAAHGIEFLKAGYNVLVMRTFSKLYSLAALRIGYVLGPTAVLDAVNRTREPFNVNHLAQVAAVAALSDEEHIAETKKVTREGFEYLKQGLAELGYDVVPTQANFFIFDTKVDDKELFQALLHEGVIVRSGSGVGLPGYLRISIGTQAENVRFLTAFKQVISKIQQNV
jgi:histidinol-phosphate aminotransferase